ncbi:conserved hypothetical protein [Talaromyces stipitatus ATCC 10500]|uniref:Zn(2)-C6 fungal-type domain-containing protein n=1 Tax=Talaromyces stipitatus (strain ATCC 10500 / CBS 375.48 / QM 6759 / NRRL 1006) TaxID=441959 RepID=B8M0S5_TALSN|nr:uncharacterized protein TSTA_086910 [Talaromyces stipitatus ATCC 10500]EED21458.1 conserved hypothetical protein [Talaromyces stipitatus ATCC 10500]
MSTNNKRPRVEYSNGRHAQEEEYGSEQRARKACINCRRQKMKCIAEDNSDGCRRCRRSGLPCIFVPRANAATLPEFNTRASESGFKTDVLRRLKIIEDTLGLSEAHNAPSEHIDCGDCEGSDDDEGYPDEFNSLHALWDAVVILQSSAPGFVPRSIWRRHTVRDLWLSFHDRMPGLHFMPRKQTFSAPQPILLASILYCSSMRGPPDMAEIAPHYFIVLCNAIAQLCIPGTKIGQMPEDSEEWAFQTVLGIVIAGLLTEATIRETGIWISIAYRLILEHCPAHIDETSREWRKLFSGVQIIDLEHASLHLSCPVIPIESPLPGLRTSPRDQLYRLSRMMRAGLTHFTGRGLPTIWSCFTTDQPSTAVALTNSFTAVDAAVIRDWARQLDEWLVDFSQGLEGSDHDLKLVFRQYVLHRLVVLSIYHPARGCDLWSNSITPKEQYELLLSARATLKLHSHDDSIWSNWDLIMITWAALIVVQAIEGGAGEHDDLTNIRIHLEMLKRMNKTTPSLCDKLINRLELSLTNVHTPASADFRQQQNTYDDLTVGAPIDLSWQIFDRSSLQQMMYTDWPAHNVNEEATLS